MARWCENQTERYERHVHDNVSMPFRILRDAQLGLMTSTKTHIDADRSAWPQLSIPMHLPEHLSWTLFPQSCFETPGWFYRSLHEKFTIPPNLKVGNNSGAFQDNISNVNINNVSTYYTYPKFQPIFNNASKCLNPIIDGKISARGRWRSSRSEYILRSDWSPLDNAIAMVERGKEQRNTKIERSTTRLV